MGTTQLFNQPLCNMIIREQIYIEKDCLKGRQNFEILLEY